MAMHAQTQWPSGFSGTFLQDAPHWHVDPTAHLVWWCHRLCLADVLRRHLAHTGEACQTHGTDDFVLQDLQHAHDAVLTTSGKAPRLHSAKPVINLAATVIGHPDDIHPVLHGELRVLSSLDTLEHEG